MSGSHVQGWLSNLSPPIGQGLRLRDAPTTLTVTPIPYYARSLHMSDVGSSRSSSRLGAQSRLEKQRTESSCCSWASSATKRSVHFDRHRENSRCSGVTVPSTSGSEPLHLRRPDIPMLVTGRLPCEFLVYSNCMQSFEMDEENEWVSHIFEDHLDGNWPEACVCWICDRPRFYTSAASPTEREATYRDRMHHIAEHLNVIGPIAAASIRPDIFFLYHLRNNGLISDAVFEVERRRCETMRPDIRLGPDTFIPGRNRNRCEMNIANNRSRRAGRAVQVYL